LDHSNAGSREVPMTLWTLSVIVAAAAVLLLLTAVTLPPAGKARRIHLVYGTLAALAGLAAGWAWNHDYRLVRASRVAEKLSDVHIPPEARIQAALTFFETNKKLYPGTYE